MTTLQSVSERRRNQPKTSRHIDLPSQSFIEDPWLGNAQKLTGPALLGFVGIELGSVKAIPIAQHLAEKIHAYTKQHGTHGSTRVKDLVDMVLLIDAAPIEVATQVDMLRKVVQARPDGKHPTLALLTGYQFRP